MFPVASATIESPPQITLVIFHAVFFQEFEILFLKGLRLMMRALISNVIHDARYIRFAHGECPVTILSCEILQMGELFVNPFRRITFQVFGDFKRRQGRRSHQQRVDMIVNAANLNGGHFVLARNAAKVCPKALFNIWPDECRSVLRAENDVVEQGGVCIGHVALLSSAVQPSLTRLTAAPIVPWVETHGCNGQDHPVASATVEPTRVINQTSCSIVADATRTIFPISSPGVETPG
jgi:hypothetical protein